MIESRARDERRRARHGGRMFGRVAALLAALVAASWLRTSETDAQRAPLLVLSSQPLRDRGRPAPRGVWVDELRIDDDGSFVLEGRSGRLGRGQLTALRAALQRARWSSARPEVQCEAIPTVLRRAQSQRRSVLWETPCGRVPHPSVTQAIERARSMAAAASSSAQPSDAGTPSSADASASVTDAGVSTPSRSSDPRACTGPGQCVLACPEVAGCCGNPCGCRAAIHRDHLADFTAQYARTCDRAPRCPAMGCAFEQRSAACVAGRCVTVPGVGF